MDPILPILDHPRPLDLVQQALDAHQKDIHAQFLAEKDLTPRQAGAWRDHLLISMLCRLPLRAKHWGLMSYLQNNTGSLRFHPVDGWLLVVPFDEFKNVRNTKIFNAYGGVRELVLRLSELESFQSLVPTLEFYLETVWSKIPNQSDRLFPSNTGLLLRTPIVTQRVRSWSEFYLSEHAVKGIQIPGVRPFGAHAFRDIVATHIIKTTGSIEMAANILLDDVATVEKHYARFLPENRLTNAMNSFSNVFAPA